jgi:rRNA processing protein Gar1
VHTGAVGKRFSPTTVERRERLMARDERLKELDDKYEDYAIYDNAGEKIGKVDDVFINETDREEYIGVKMGGITSVSWTGSIYATATPSIVASS